ncbi:MAG: nuclear transport factor 2 family protein [Flavobacteriaceae bacterium]|nr:nuclear transport factor 2 family protein [Flavobacteriaceae bacterium]
MRYFNCSLVIFFFLVGNYVSGQEDHQEQIKNVIERFFDGLHNGDTLIIKETIRSDIKIQTAFESNKGTSELRDVELASFLKSLASKKKEDSWKEELLDFSIHVDKNIASVWTPYRFYFNNNFSHCGSNSFQLFNDNGNWKIIYLLDTRKKKDCDE